MKVNMKTFAKPALVNISVPLTPTVPIASQTTPINTDPKAKPYLSPHANAFTKNSIADALNFPPQYFSGSQLINLYNVPTVTNTRTRQVKVAIIVAFTYPGLLNDLNIYWKNSINFGQNSTPPKVSVYTMPGATFNDGWAQEECLDVQMVCTINPNANIYVIEAKSDKMTDLFAAINYATNTIKADVVSMSWGLTDDKSLTQYGSYFTNPAVCYCAASGDNNNASWPSVLSNCISVGGTTLLWTPSSPSPRTEFAWSYAGCGYAVSVRQPEYQQNISGINHTYRVVPDVSLIANDLTSVYTVYKGNWYGVGGTSVAAPIFAAMLSLANQQRFNQGKPPLTTVYTNASPNNVQNYMYNIIYATPSLYASAFNDISIGSGLGSILGNANLLTTYTASAKYDIPTGLGSPNCANFCNQLMNI
jgi:subtilase family serine protease